MPCYEINEKILSYMMSCDIFGMQRGFILHYIIICYLRGGRSPATSTMATVAVADVGEVAALMHIMFRSM